MNLINQILSDLIKKKIFIKKEKIKAIHIQQISKNIN